MVRLLAGCLLAALLISALAAAGPDAGRHPRRQHLDCGTVQAADDWNVQDMHGDLSALGGEICRAVAVAILGADDGRRSTPSPPSPKRWPALKAGAIQLAVGISPSATIAMQYGVGFGPPVFYDSQRFMVAKAERHHQTSPGCATS